MYGVDGVDRPSTYIQTNSYNDVDVKKIDFGALFGALKRKTAAELLLLRFSVEVVGFELKVQSHLQTLVIMISIAYFCKRSFLTPPVFGIFLGYDFSSGGTGI